MTRAALPFALLLLAVASPCFGQDQSQIKIQEMDEAAHDRAADRIGEIEDQGAIGPDAIPEPVGAHRLYHDSPGGTPPSNAGGNAFGDSSGAAFPSDGGNAYPDVPPNR